MSFKMKKAVTRKLFLFGRYSLALLPPKKWLSKLGVKEGDVVNLKLDSSKRRLIVTFDTEKITTPQEGKESAIENNDKPKDDWEPIPRI